MNHAVDILSASHELYGRADPTTAVRPPVYKAIGITLAICSGLFIGCSFVLKKVGLLRSNAKYNEEAGEGYSYLKNGYWWTGMTLMIIGEICNFVAYAFVDAILVTPLGALSVVITTILSAIFLKERLSFVGKIGCFICIIGSIIIVLNAPEQSSAATIQEMQNFVIAPGFLTYTGLVLIGSAFMSFWVAPKYGKKSMLVYLTICSFVGGLSVVATQGLGAAVVAQAGGTPQFNQWFIYVLLVFVVGTLVTEIIFLNKALNLFNAALVTPTYYVYFTSCTIVSSSILFRGFKGTPGSIATIVMGFLQICAGVVLLQLSKSSKDVPDAAVFAGDLDQIRTVAEQEEPESEPKADAIRGTAAIIRRISQSRQKMEEAEAKRVYEDRKKDQMEPIGENERVDWDGLRRRKTILFPGDGGQRLERRKTLHPPLGLSKFPDYDEDEGRPTTASSYRGSFLSSFNRNRRNTQSVLPHSRLANPDVEGDPAAMEQVNAAFKAKDFASNKNNFLGDHMEMEHVYGMPPGLRQDNLDGTVSSNPLSPGPQGVSAHGLPLKWGPDVRDNTISKDPPRPEPIPTARRQFSFTNVFHRGQKQDNASDSQVPTRKGLGGLGLRTSSNEHSIPKAPKSATEEERLGLVKGESGMNIPEYSSSEGDLSPVDGKTSPSRPRPSGLRALTTDNELKNEPYVPRRPNWSSRDVPTTPGAKPLPVTPKLTAPNTPNPNRDLEEEGKRGRYENLGPDDQTGGGNGSGTGLGGAFL